MQSYQKKQWDFIAEASLVQYDVNLIGINTWDRDAVVLQHSVLQILLKQNV